MSRSSRSAQHGQALPLFALALAALTLGAAVVVDGGYAFAQRRAAQNAADLAAMAGTRVVGVKLTGRPSGAGTAHNVENAITTVLAANGAQLVSAQYVDQNGGALGSVLGGSAIPEGAFGVVVEARTDWQPFLLGTIGVTDWVASARATAVTPGRSVGGGVLPVGLEDDTFDALETCPLTSLDDCVNQKLTSGQLNIPGGFGWLSFGLQGSGGRCDWDNSLGMVADGGCQANQPFLQSQIGPPPVQHGCCTSVGLPGSADFIASLTGNEWGDLSYYIDNKIPVWVPVWDEDHSGGTNGYYHIAGFGAIILTGQGTEHAKWLQGSAIEVPCALPGHQYCAGPGGSFTVDVTGEVRLVR